MNETIYIIDGYAQIFRAYYAIRNGMYSPVTGEPTHAVFGFSAMLLRLLTELKPDYIVVALDTPGQTFRDRMYAGYKATRTAIPEDLLAQVPRVAEVCRAFGIPVIDLPLYEADDLAATLVNRILSSAASAHIDVRIVAKDKDMEQLLCDRVCLYDVHTGLVTDCAAVLAKRGITPEQVIDLLALCGDTVDNIPGVAGIGPKTAAALLNEFGSLDGIYANLNRIQGKRRENLEAARDSVPLSRSLVTLKADCEFEFDLEAARVRPPSPDRLIPLFEELGFHRFQDEVRRLAHPHAQPPMAQPLSSHESVASDRSGVPATGSLFAEIADASAIA